MRKTRKIVKTEPQEVLSTTLEQYAISAARYKTKKQSASTKRAYKSMVKAWESWCDGLGVCSRPASPFVVASYLGYLADQGYAAATIALACTAISQFHKSANLESPTSAPVVSGVMAGVRVVIGTRQQSVEALEASQIRALVLAIDQGGGSELVKTRDRAILLLGFAGAFRRSEISGLNVEDVSIVADGALLMVTRSKTDQVGEGEKKAIVPGSGAFCPVAALCAWLACLPPGDGPLFRQLNKGGRWMSGADGSKGLSGRAISEMIKRRCEAIGIDPSTVGGHSLRSGFATSAARAGASERLIMKQTGHKTERAVRRYIKAGQAFLEHPGRGLL
jgi:site-specific recombinase XerD